MSKQFRPLTGDTAAFKGLKITISKETLFECTFIIHLMQQILKWYSKANVYAINAAQNETFIVTFEFSNNNDNFMLYNAYNSIFGVNFNFPFDLCISTKTKSIDSKT